MQVRLRAYFLISFIEIVFSFSKLKPGHLPARNPTFFPLSANNSTPPLFRSKKAYPQTQMLSSFYAARVLQNAAAPSLLPQ